MVIHILQIMMHHFHRQTTIHVLKCLKKVSAPVVYLPMPACVIEWSQWSCKGSHGIPFILQPAPLSPLLLGFHPFLPNQWVLITQDPLQIYPIREKVTLMNACTAEHCCHNEQPLPGLFIRQHLSRETPRIQNEWFLSPAIVRIRTSIEALSPCQVSKAVLANGILSVSTELD